MGPRTSTRERNRLSVAPTRPVTTSTPANMLHLHPLTADPRLTAALALAAQLRAASDLRVSQARTPGLAGTLPNCSKAQ